MIGTLKRILDMAQDDQDIAVNPVIANCRRTTKRSAQPFKHHPLTANQVASVVNCIATSREVTVIPSAAGEQPHTYTRHGNRVYALAILFAAHTGVRAAEPQGLQAQDITLSDIPGTAGQRPRCPHRFAQEPRLDLRPKSDASADRIVPLAPWLADELRDYLTTVHPFAGKYGHAPLFPGRRNRHAFDWAKPVCAASLYEHYLQPATRALGLGAVRLHDLRHTFATMNLSAGEHYMQVSKWLGHSTFVLTLTTYADYINEDEQVAPKVGRGVVDTAATVAPMQRKAN
ncbi:tyrosine-type recombinase/integrase [Mycolicibacterium goodii]|uniref:tyrosine-type recombinase/integrase n=1 Tax=Mycolicibacterium goodii TaxID=134601 RepID=UPI00256EA5A0|nr:tyrosine-type recombinase/integrase [Mycolicibacterium goodii]